MSNQVVVITGASSGIGATLGELLSTRGMTVVLVARRKELLDEVASRCNGHALAIAADVSVRAEVKRVVETTLAQFNRIDVWVNNAGQGITRLPSELTEEDVDFMISSNVKSALYGMQETLPHFKVRGSGHVINVSSLLGRVPYVPFRSAYCGAKHFLNGLTATFRAEVQQTHPDIQFSLVSPGVVQTDFGLKALHGGPDSRGLPESQTAEEVAEVIAGVIESRKPDVYTRKGVHDRIVGYYAGVGVDP